MSDDVERRCRICGARDILPSMGGPDVCPPCDMGRWPDGREWTYREAMALIGPIEQRATWARLAHSARVDAALAALTDHPGHRANHDG